ncbi:MAG TPA: hypothetical protein PKA53_01860 [Sphingobacterium sp.]|nr:hypothetical protein [Sphingobacterium sp.]
MQDWQKAVDYATLAIGTDPRPLLRDNRWIRQNAIGEVHVVARYYNSSSLKANLMISTAYSILGIYFGPYYGGGRFAHGSRIATTETFSANGPYGPRASNGYIPMVYVYRAANIDKYLVPRLTDDFEMTDPVAQTGFYHTVYAPFTTEETMLVRAEALIHLKRYDEAAVDMKRWVDNTLVTPPSVFDKNTIHSWATTIDYYTPAVPTAKKTLNPEFAIEAGMQESMIHALLFIRRLETMHTGLRWFDVKRYGIEVERRIITPAGITYEPSTKLTNRDNRAALQLPADVISAGLTPNPR